MTTVGVPFVLPYQFPPFEPVQESDASGPLAYQSITAQDAYKTRSFEELRVYDYEMGRGILSDSLLPLHVLNRQFPGFKLQPLWEKEHVGRQRRRFDVESCILVKVTDEEEVGKDFSIPATFLLETSDYFKGCLRQGWSEHDSRTIELKETDPDIFERYVEWLYRCELCIENSYDGIDRVHVLAELFILGDRLQDIPFKNTVMDKFLRYASGPEQFHADVDLITLVFDNLPEHSPLRRFFVDLEVYSPTAGFTDGLKLGKHPVPLEYMCELLEKSKGLQPVDRPPWYEKELYHEKKRFGDDEARP